MIRQIRRAWDASLDHVGGLGVFSLFLFGGLGVLMFYRGRPGFALLAMLMWYVSARSTRDKYRKQNEALATIDMLEADGAISEVHASKLRKAIRNG